MTEVVFIGTSDAFGAGGRRQSAILVRAPRGGVLLDCGMTTGSGMNELSIPRDEIETILISHFHADHFGGIPPFLLGALYEDRRTEPLRIAGPPGIQRRVYNLADAMGYGIEERPWSFPISFEEIPTDRPLEVGPVKAQAFEVVHQPHTKPHGLILDTGSQRLAYSGDTGWFDDLPKRIGDVDLFISECTYHHQGFEYHLSYDDLLAGRERFQCGRMILTHLGHTMADRRGEGEFETADDGLAFRL